MNDEIKKQAYERAILMHVENESDKLRRELEIENAIGVNHWDRTQLLVAATNLEIFEDVNVSEFDEKPLA